MRQFSHLRTFGVAPNRQKFSGQMREKETLDIGLFVYEWPFLSISPCESGIFAVRPVPFHRNQPFLGSQTERLLCPGIGEHDPIRCITGL